MFVTVQCVHFTGCNLTALYRLLFFINNCISDPDILDKLEANGNITFTPSRRIKTRRIVSYDDRYILDAAVELDGVVVSNDHFRDFLELEGGKYKKIIEDQLLMYTFVEDM